MSKGKLIVAAPDRCADLLYAGGFSAPDEVIYFETAGSKNLVVSILEYDRARSQARKGVNILPLEKYLDSESRNCPAVLRNLSKAFGVTEWTVPGDFPLLYASKLTAEGIRVTPAEKGFCPKREIKTSREIRLLKEVMAVTEETMEMVEAIFRESTVGTGGILRYQGKPLTSERIISEAESFMKLCHCTSSGMIAACGALAAQPHNQGTGPILAGETVVVDIFPRSDRTGYWGDMTRTFVKGKASPMAKKAFDAVLRASQTAEKMVKDGVIASEVHEAAAEVMRAAGFRTGRNRDNVPCGFIHGLGHGIGLEIHEAPRVSPVNKTPLKAGNVISNEPGLYDPAWGGIRLEDALVVTEEGSMNFYTMPKEMEIP